MAELLKNKEKIKFPGWKNSIRLIVLMVAGTSMQYLVDLKQQVLGSEGASIPPQTRLKLKFKTEI